MENRFEYNGTTYYQEYRKCSKEGCKCQNGHPHGPYWYCKNSSYGTKYLGKHCPEEIRLRAEMHRNNFSILIIKKNRLLKAISYMTKNLDIVNKSLQNEKLTPEEWNYIDMTVNDYGFWSKREMNSLE